MNKFSVFVFLLILLSLTSCSKPNIEDTFNPGQEFTQSNARLIEIDTFTVNMSTFKYDSIVSSNDRLLVGQYNDPFFGIVKSSAFVEFTPSNYVIDENAQFDSIVLNLKYDSFYYNDTLRQKKVVIHELLKEIRLKNGQTEYYNTTDVLSSTSILGSKNFFPRISKDSTTITLNPSFGLNLFSKIKTNVINNYEEFKDYFKGLKITSDDSENAAIMGFDPNASYIRMYYSLPDQTTSTIYEFDLRYNTSSKKNFNKIESNRNNTVLQNLSGQENELRSTSTNSLSFIQSGIGITTKFTFPSIKTINQINDGEGTVFKSDLKIRLNNSNYNNSLKPNDSLQLYVVNQNNAVVTKLRKSNGEDIIARVIKQSQEFNEVYLTVPVDVFIKRVLENDLYRNYGLILLPYNNSNSVQRSVLNGETNNHDKTKLELVYAIYDN